MVLKSHLKIRVTDRTPFDFLIGKVQGQCSAVAFRTEQNSNEHQDSGRKVHIELV